MRIGILGAGQLGRMLGLAGYPLGHSFVFYDFNGSCASCPGEVIVDCDGKNLEYFLSRVDCVTYELEDVPLQLLAAIAHKVPVLPNAGALSIAKNRIKEKSLFVQLGIPTTEFFSASSALELKQCIAKLGGKAVIKTISGGYDGKGQAVATDSSDSADIWERLGSSHLLVEELVTFTREISIIACRGKSGEVCFYSPSENIHENGILKYSIAPSANITKAQASKAQTYITKLLNHLNYVGVLTLELFVTDQGLIANEIATRVHNSGHLTMDGAVTCQFENHIRAIAGQPLGSTEPTGIGMMINIIGEYGNFSKLLTKPSLHCYSYGKTEAPGRKLAHINLVAESSNSLFSTAFNSLKDTAHWDDIKYFKR